MIHRDPQGPGDPHITLTTDFGLHDHYVAAMKGVIASIAPAARVTDICHSIAPQNVTHGGFVLWQAMRWFPAGTIHVAVVDPGVGTSRRILLGRYGGQFVIAPDNGLLTFIHREFRAEDMLVIENRNYFQTQLSMTFHGRDIMAPVAAHLANGTPLHNFGRATDRIEVLPISCRADVTGKSIHGQVLYVDHFGTLVSNVHREQLESLGRPGHALQVRCGGRNIGPLRSTFGEVAPGALLALVGSADLMEIAVNCGRADALFTDLADVVVEVS
ncbi:MAG: SAM-dependent chlorinase/fluorinase [Phycisphaerae bacterium]|nr:SAM-dependent chlorinase/fluorinase [Phycisphaerae bacterium]